MGQWEFIIYSVVISMLRIIYFFGYFCYIDGCGSLFIYEMIYYTYYCSLYSQACLRLLVFVYVYVDPHLL